MPAVHLGAQTHGKAGRAAGTVDLPAADYWLGLLPQQGNTPRFFLHAVLQRH